VSVRQVAFLVESDRGKGLSQHEVVVGKVLGRHCRSR
jgi:hypothetical protein